MYSARSTLLQFTVSKQCVWPRKNEFTTWTAKTIGCFIEGEGYVSRISKDKTFIKRSSFHIHTRFATVAFVMELIDCFPFTNSVTTTKTDIFRTKCKILVVETRAAPYSPTYKWRTNVMDDTTSLYNAQRDRTN